MKEYTFNITLKFTQSATAESKEKALGEIRESFYQDYGLHLEDDDIKYIED